MTASRQLSGLFAVPLGVDFPRALIAGLDARFGHARPEALARVSLYVNTTRMRRRLLALYTQGPARLLPRIRLITDLGPPAVEADRTSPLRRRLELTRLVQRLIQAEPTLAPESAAFDLAGSLSALLDEMQGEGVSLQEIAGLDVSDLSGHWARSQRFLNLLTPYLGASGLAPQDPNLIKRAAAVEVIKEWQSSPPKDPVVIAGSTGSRGTTRLLMEAVARLPTGAVVLPGIDRDMPDAVWTQLMEPDPQQDHPQYRTAVLARALDLRPGALPLWDESPPAVPERNRLISLALRPAPVTDGWLRDGPDLGPLGPATENLTLIEAVDPREEADAIALLLREAVETGQSAALVTPDRMLTRRVSAALDRWGILPDDSAGEPLRQSPVGRLLRHVAGLFGRPLTAEHLLVLLKHPLVQAGSGRGPHILSTRELELKLRRDGPAFPDAESLRAWAEEATDQSRQRHQWADWVARTCCGHDARGPRPLSDYVATIAQLVDALIAGPEAAESPAEWPGPDGAKAARIVRELHAEAPHGSEMTPPAFQALLAELLSEDVREPVQPWDSVMIWGTLEARVQGADLLVLGGLNDGIWPETPATDPWLNRAMRLQAGLLLPERQVGLSAHDFQQAIAARHVTLTRSRRNQDTETVPSRWLNRFLNLLDGLPEQGGRTALAGMRDRGARWLRFARALDRPAEQAPPAARPSPCPPVAARPRRLSVTEIESLIRDPYAVYARRILKLSPLETLRKTPDARARGTVLHSVLEHFVPIFSRLSEADRLPELLAVAERELATQVPWPATRRLWLARLARNAQWFIDGEAERQMVAAPAGFESRGRLELPELEFTLSAKADRIDRTPDGQLCLYDYKTGNPPNAERQKIFNQQLLLEVLIAEHAGFSDVPAAPVARAEYIGLGSSPSIVAAPMDDVPTEKTRADLVRLLAAFADPDKGYTAQLARFSMQDEGDFDHLSRSGEWDLSMPPKRERVGG